MVSEQAVDGGIGRQATEGAAAIGLSLMEDPTSPYFLQQSDNLNSVVINPAVNGMNYFTWSRSFEMELIFRNKIGFIDGSVGVLDMNDPLYPT